jgi:plastocyanin
MHGIGRLTRRRVLELLAAGAMGLVATPVLAACGTDTAGSGSKAGGFTNEPAAQRVEVAAARDGAMRWDRAEYAAVAGDVTFVVSNPSMLPHRFGVEGNGVNVHSGNVSPGKTYSYTLKGLRAGEYQIVCDYPGHRQAGMVAKLTVS